MLEPQSIVTLEGQQCRLAISRPARGVTLLVLEGRDLGDLGDAPFKELQKDLDGGAVELFIDARRAVSATMEVSGSWAVWLGARREQLTRISMLTGSRFIDLSANVVKRFADLGEKMRLYTEAESFESALREAVAARSR